jgi:hypothetical protein
VWPARRAGREEENESNLDPEFIKEQRNEANWDRILKDICLPSELTLKARGTMTHKKWGLDRGGA